MTTWSVPARVIAIHDGDTMSVDADLGWQVHKYTPVRLAGVDAPELATDAGKAALAFVADLVHINDLVMVLSHSLDKYGRTLGTVTLSDGRNLSTVLIESGHGVPYDGGKRNP